jgi:glutaredoxin
MLFWLCVAFGLTQNWGRIDAWLNPPPPRQAQAGQDVVLYATSWCGYCAKTRTFFAENNIPYVEVNVEEAGDGQREYQKLGGNGVPIVVVNEKTVIHGYNPEGIKLALERTP